MISRSFRLKKFKNAGDFFQTLKPPKKIPEKLLGKFAFNFSHEKIEYLEIIQTILMQTFFCAIKEKFF
jgi:hypothetical protein